MAHIYNKKHVQISVAAASALGMTLGFWLGKRSGEAGVIETIVVLLGFVVLSSFIFSRIDKDHLPEKNG